MTERLSQALRDATKELHVEAERAGVMGALLKGRVGRAEYVALLSSLHAIYDALESAMRQHTGHRVIGPLINEGLERRHALEADLRALAGDAWPMTHPPHDLAVSYAAHLRTLGNVEPGRLAAHAWLRYLGDLNGGQIIARIVRKALALEQDATNFYAFPAFSDPHATAAEWRAALDGLSLGEVSQRAIVDEACDGFRLHIALFEALAPQDAASSAPAE